MRFALPPPSELLSVAIETATSGRSLVVGSRLVGALAKRSPKAPAPVFIKSWAGLQWYGMLACIWRRPDYIKCGEARAAILCLEVLSRTLEARCSRVVDLCDSLVVVHAWAQRRISSAGLCAPLHR